MKENKNEKTSLEVKKEQNPVKGRWIRKTSLTVLLILIIIAVCIGINLAVENANFEDIDVTKDKVYSLSEKSKDIINSIDKEINVMMINMGEAEEDFVKKYSNINDLIKIEVINNITARPDLADEYGITADQQAIIVKCGDREKLLSSGDLYEMDYSTYQTKDTTEEALTNALISVTTEKKPVIYNLTGHNKYSTSDMYLFNLNLENEAYEVNDLDLLTKGAVPDDCSVLMITTLIEDITKKERDEIIDYINKGGKILLFSEPNATGKEMKNFQDVLDEYGVSIPDGILVEQDSNKMLYQNPTAILVTVSPYTSVTKEADMYMNACFIASGKIDIADSDKLKELGVQAEILATTSENTFLRTDYSLESNNFVEGSDKEMGNATVGALLKKTVKDDKTSELIVYSNNVFVSNLRISESDGYSYVLSYYNNEDLAMNSMAYLTERDNMITIRKDVEVTAYTVTDQQNKIILAIIFGIPVMIIIVGIIVWQYRRRKR